MIFFLAILIIPILIACVVFFLLNTINWKEFLLQVLAQCIVAGASAGIVYSANTSDTEIWGGVVASKHRKRVSCSHSYQCNCHEVCSGTGKNKSCYQSCDTCYDHSYDVDWFLKTSNDERINIRRVNRQGTVQPPRWTSIVIGEPTAVEHSYTNYIKASPDTLFKRTGFEGYKIPKYPDDIYDYYRLNRITGDGKLNHPELWKKELSDIAGHIAAKKQANLILVVTEQGHDFYYALQEAWLGGKKNDVILVIGKNGLDIKWADVLAWSQDSNINVQLRSDVMDIGKMDREKILNAFKINTLRYYKRKPMHDFEYLKSSITPTTTQWAVTSIIGLLVALGLSYLFHRKDVFGDEGFRYRRRYY